MKRFKNQLIAAAVLAGLGLIGSFMNSHPAVLQAAGGPTVTIDPSQLPLHVTGSTTVTGAVTVAGTVAATQSGLWNVGITGVPNVSVTNPATSPVLVRDVDNAARSFITLELSPTSNPTYTVPAGKILVLEQILGGPETSTGSVTYSLDFNGDFGASGTNHNRWGMFLSTPPCLGPSCSMAQPIHVYANSGQTISLSSVPSTNVQLYFQGYLINAN